jgi:hypothetical protein
MPSSKTSLFGKRHATIPTCSLRAAYRGGHSGQPAMGFMKMKTLTEKEKDELAAHVREIKRLVKKLVRETSPKIREIKRLKRNHERRIRRLIKANSYQPTMELRK